MRFLLESVLRTEYIDLLNIKIGKGYGMTDLSNFEKNADYVLSEEDVQKLFAYLEEKLESSPCDHTLRYTEQWLRDNVSAELLEGAVAEINDMGGFCDCEVLFNCYEDYDIE